MPQQLIDVGLAPNDKKGEGLRSACEKINAMFAEIYGFTTSFTNSLALRALIANVIVNNAVQTLSAEAKLRHALNAGTLVPLFAELVPPQNAATVSTHQVMTLPAAFILYDATLTFDQQQTGSIITAVIERQLPNFTWQTIFSNAGAINNRAFAIGSEAVGITLDAGTRVRLRVPAINTPGYGAFNMGMQMWMRGVWA